MKIKILNSVTGVLPSMKHDGSIYLDLPRLFSLSLSKSLSSVQAQEIRDEGALNFSIPQTPLNNILARQITNQNKVSDTALGYDVIVIEGAIVHNFNRLFFVSSNDIDNNYTIRLTQGDEHWLPKAQNTYLNEIDFSETRFDVSTINTLNGRSGYVDGEEGVVFPLVNYGKFTKPLEVVIEDLRPMMFMLKVLRDGFCHIGWKFVCPTLESTAGRKIITYTNSKGFGENPELLESKKFSAGLNDNKINFNVEIFDNGDVFEPADVGTFVGNGVHTFTILLEGVYPGPYFNPTSITISVRKTNGDIIGSRVINSDYLSRSFRVEFKVEAVLSASDSVYADIRGDISRLTVTNAVFYNTPKSSALTRGQSFKVSEYQGRYSFLDYFKGCVHLINGKVVTDWVNKTVSLYSPYDIEWYDESIEGFYLSTIKDWSDKLIPNSRSIDDSALSKQRFQVFSFADSNDAHIDELKLEEEKPLFSKRVDLGTDYVEGEEKNDNKFFEPTKNDKVNELTAGLRNNIPLDAPFMLDNNEGELSFDIGPRVLFWNGPSRQTSNDGSVVGYLRIEGANTFDIPYAFQVPGAYVDNGTTIDPPRYNLSFEDDENSLYSVFYEREFKEGLIMKSSGYQSIVSSYEYDTTNFRHKYKAYYNGDTFVFRLLEINNYQTCSNAPIQVVTRPELFIGDVCGTNINETVVNEPQIRIKYNTDTEEIAAERVSTRISSPIATDTFTYSTDGGLIFEPYVDNTPISSPNIIFKRVVTYSDEAPETQLEEIANLQKLCNNQPLIEMNINYEANTVSAFALDNVASTIDTDVWTVSIDGTAPISYTPGTDLTGFSTLSFVRTINFTDHCPEIVLQRDYTATAVECDNKPVLVWNELADCTYVLSINTDNVDSTIGMTHFQVYNPHTQKWDPWNGSPIRGEAGVIAKVRILYRGNCPPSTLEEPCPAAP